MVIKFFSTIKDSHEYFIQKDNGEIWVFFFGNENILALFLEFCPANCDWEKEMTCPGKWNEDWTEQISGDYCIPMKSGDCYNHCPMDCGKDMMCPGGMDPKGCPMPDMCFPAGKDCPKM